MCDLQAALKTAYEERAKKDAEELDGIKQRWAGYIRNSIVAREKSAEVYAPPVRYAMALREWVKRAGLVCDPKDSTYWYISGWEE